MIDGHGDDSYRYGDKITSNFSSNISTTADLSALQTHLGNKLSSIGRYPEPQPYTLEAALAQSHHLPAAAVCATNGATEAIYLIAQTFRGTHSAVLQPTFSEYADACRMHGHKVTSLYTLPKHLPETVRVVWICNPNNPTGTVIEKRQLQEVVTSHPEVYFIIDQSYEAFTLKELFSAGEAAQYPNVLLLHSLTKQYAIPGLRLGYLTGHAALLDHIRCSRMPWSVNQLAVEAGLFLCAHPQKLDLKPLIDETQRLKSLLETTGMVEVWPTDTHYILVRLRMGRASALKEYLAQEQGILIRDASNFEGLDDSFFRIATQTAPENDRLVRHLVEYLLA